MPAAIRTRAATRCSPRPIWRCGSPRRRQDGLTVNPAKIDGGGPNNVVPDHAVLRVNMRPAHARRLQAQAQALLDEAVAAVAAKHDVTIHVHGGFARAPKPLDPQAEKLFGLVKRSRRRSRPGDRLARHAAGSATATISPPAACRSSTRWARAAAPSIRSDEFLIVESLVERAQLSALTILRLASGEAL